MRLAMIGVNLQGFLINGACIGILTEGAQHFTQTQQSTQMPRRLAQQDSVTVCGGCRVAVRGSGTTEIEQGIGIVRAELQRAAVTRDGIAEATGIAQHIRQVVVEHRYLRPRC